MESHRGVTDLVAELRKEMSSEIDNAVLVEKVLERSSNPGEAVLVVSSLRDIPIEEAYALVGNRLAQQQNGTEFNTHAHVRRFVFPSGESITTYSGTDIEIEIGDYISLSKEGVIQIGSGKKREGWIVAAIRGGLRVGDPSIYVLDRAQDSD